MPSASASRADHSTNKEMAFGPSASDKILFDPNSQEAHHHTSSISWFLIVTFKSYFISENIKAFCGGPFSNPEHKFTSWQGKEKLSLASPLGLSQFPVVHTHHFLTNRNAQLGFFLACQLQDTLKGFVSKTS